MSSDGRVEPDSSSIAVRRPLAAGEPVDAAARRRLLLEVEAIFFDSSAVQSFASEAARKEFRERWLDRYLERWPGEVFVAEASDGATAGYLVGFIGDAAREPAFADIPYFRDFKRQSATFPAHLHINVAEAWRNRGLGALLIEAFCAHAAAAGVAGVHVVTGEFSRNVRFYERCGFDMRGRAASPWNGSPIVLLGRRLP
jgi:GNAT superfamily N-acetyltransferase